MRLKSPILIQQSNNQIIIDYLKIAYLNQRLKSKQKFIDSRIQLIKNENPYMNDSNQIL